MELHTLSLEEVLLIHETLVADFAVSNDPISPAGVRSIGLLASAVGRQATGIGNTLKYPDPVPNAATLMYGLCNDHPFHNGNKRTALVAMLVHLDRNKRTLFHTSQNDLYELMLKVASHTLLGAVDKRAKTPKRRASADQEVERIARWLDERADRVTRGERQVTYCDMRRILQRFGFDLEHPNNNTIQVVRFVEEEKGWLKRRVERVRKHIGTVGWPGEHRVMGVGAIKQLRKICLLTEEDGVDSDAFYSDTAIVDTFVNRYRSLLRRLAKV